MNEALSVHVEQLQHRDHNVRGRAAIDLGTLRDARSADALLRALQVEPDPFVRENITWALVRLGETVVPPLVDLLRDANASVRHHAAHALSKVGDRRAVAALIDTLHDTDAMVLTKAAFALGQLGDTRAIPALVALVGHESRELQSTLASVFERFGAPALAALLDALDDPRWQVREQAAYILGLIGRADAVSGLIAASQDQHWQVRFASAYALRDLGGARAHDALHALRDDSDTRVRGLVEKLLKRAGARR